MSGVELSLVVSTIGRPADFRRLLASVEASGVADRLELVLVDQSSDQSCAAVLAEEVRSIASRATTSARGAARGRNAGLVLARGALVGFPDDNCWYPPETLRQVLERFGAAEAAGLQLDVLSGRQVTASGSGSMLRWLPEPAPVTRRNFMRTTIMSSMFFRRPAVDAAGRFDEGMGVGSEGWYGAGEESDLLLKILAADGVAEYDPQLTVLQDETRDDADPAFVGKMLRYGCGMGHLWRLHHLPVDQLAWYSARKAVGAAVRAASGRRTLARADLAYLRGTAAGVLDRPPRGLRPPR